MSETPTPPVTGDGYQPKVPTIVRDWAYVVGIVLGLGLAPSMIALGHEPLAAVAAGLSGAANALAFGYRPGKS